MKIPRSLRLNPIDAVVIMVLIIGFAGVTFHEQAFAALQWITGIETTQEPAAPAPAQNNPDPAVSEAPAETQAIQSAQEPAQIAETYKQPSQPAAQPAAPQSEPQGAHIPFTNSPVTAGDPQSYVGTVGQCPFYEMAGDKGCVPPADIECNADWSICTKKGENL